MTTMMSLFQKMKPMEYLESTVAAFSLISNNEKSAQQGANFDFDLDFRVQERQYRNSQENPTPNLTEMAIVQPHELFLRFG